MHAKPLSDFLQLLTVSVSQTGRIQLSRTHDNSHIMNSYRNAYLSGLLLVTSANMFSWCHSLPHGSKSTPHLSNSVSVQVTVTATGHAAIGSGTFTVLVAEGDAPYAFCEDNLSCDAGELKFYNLTKLNDDRYGKNSILAYNTPTRIVG